MSEPSDVAPSVPPLPPGQTGIGSHEVTVDLAAFLPEGTELVVDPADAWETDPPEPEVLRPRNPGPPRALEDAPAASVAPEPLATVGPASTPSPEADALDRIDLELAAVDEALVALDAGAPERSPLLRGLLGD